MQRDAWRWGLGASGNQEARGGGGLRRGYSIVQAWLCVYMTMQRDITSACSFLAAAHTADSAQHICNQTG